MDRKDTVGGGSAQGNSPRGIGGWARSVADSFRRLPPRSKRGLALAAMMAVVLVGYTIIIARQGPIDRIRINPSTQDSGSGDPSEAVIIVEPDAGDDPVDAAANASDDAAYEPTPGTFLWPVMGELIAGYGWGYSETHEDWRFHSGIDLIPDQDEHVLAVEAGQVTEVYLDPQWGWVVEVEHGPGFVSRYAGLNKVLVSAGVDVERGDPVGIVGDSAPVEAGMPPHLHLELIRSGEPVDPLVYLSGGS